MEFLSCVCIYIFSDRFRTTVNVLGDCFGAGIVYHFTRKHLESATLPPSSSSPSSPSSDINSTAKDSPLTDKKFEGENNQVTMSSPQTGSGGIPTADLDKRNTGGDVGAPSNSTPPIKDTYM